MNSLIAALEGNKIVTRTENGAPTNSTSGSRLLDLFGQGGALRTRDEKSIEKLFKDAFNEDKTLAVKTAFYLRDIRGGLGERRTFRVILNWLAFNAPAIVRKNLANIAEYGRYDDLMTLFSTPVENDMIEFVKNAIVADLKVERPSLLAKWLPSINASSAVTKKNGRKLAKALGLTEKQYRQALSTLRGKISLVESAMCSKEWDSIKFENVPSRASMNYRKAFYKNDPVRYAEYIKAVEKGEKKINASTLFPYDIVRNVWNMTSSWGYGNSNSMDVSTLDAQWNALPNYFDETAEFKRPIVASDVSGSMMSNNGLPMYTSIGLGIYAAERMSGPFKGKYITFSATPQLVTVPSGNIKDKVQYVRNTGVGYNTNIQAMFDLILNTAVANMVPESDMPDTLMVLSDMQFDHPQNGPKTNFEVVKAKYARAGYKMPRLVFWNVDARNDESPITVNDEGVVLVSGHSASTFKSVMANKSFSPLSLFLDVVNSPRYDKVVV